ncbi:hypothetical protein [Crenalkalicoccus roseus]|uniref:hypothetical protein n=1 Tax=Crenalkalicoccus roseus TaxID=1485588 RepID=UPI0010818129|nr:hypothetical protein [Crenalkalicoccus roseus]
MRPRRLPLWPALPAALGLLAGCTVVQERPAPPPAGVYLPGAPATGLVAEGGGAGFGRAAVDPYCRRAELEARAAEREAALAARDARLSLHAGAPAWVQQQDLSLAEAAARQAERARHHALRDC